MTSEDAYDGGPVGEPVPPGDPSVDSAPFAPAPPPPPPPLTLAQLQESALRREGAHLAGTADASGRDLRYEALKAEVDALQVQVMRQQQPWFRDATAIVAVLALVFSFGTTIVSYQRTAQEDVHNAEIELRALITRLSAIPAEMTENAKTYADDPGTIASLTSIKTQEQLLLAKQAAQVIGSIPSDRVTSAQYLLVANVLLSNGIDKLDLLDEAIKVAADVNDFVSASRVKAFRLFQLGRIEEGRQLYRDALGVFDRKGFNSSDENFKAYTHLQTRVGWAQAELLVGNCDQAREQIDFARELSGRFAANDTQVRRMQTVIDALESCRPGATPPPGSASPSIP